MDAYDCRSWANTESFRNTDGFPISLSQILTTVQPSFLSARFTQRSRLLLIAIFDFQNSTFVFGRRPREGCPCQKSPSTNTATRSSRNTKSGLPNIGTPLRQPLIPQVLNKDASRSSVDLLPIERTRLISSDRAFLLRVSILRASFQSKMPMDLCDDRFYRGTIG